MPNSNLPPDNYLGDPERTTGEFQDQINNLQNWVNALQAELSALSGTTLREGAVRSVDTSGDGLVDTGQLNTRLSTTGNLGTAATKAADQDLRTTDSVQFSAIGITNDGSGSGIDADLLDGKHASEFTESSGDAPSADWYEEVRVELGGDFDAGEEIIINRIGDVVTITGVDRPQHSFSSSVSSNFVIPSSLQPSTNVTNVVSGYSANVGILTVSNAGQVQINYFDWSGSPTSEGRSPLQITYNRNNV